MEFIGTLLLIGLLLYLLMPLLRQILMRWILGRVQRTVQDHMQQQQKRSTTNARSSTSNSKRDKMEMDEIEAKRFERENSDDYVDFEELPKK